MCPRPLVVFARLGKRPLVHGQRHCLRVHSSGLGRRYGNAVRRRELPVSGRIQDGDIARSRVRRCRRCRRHGNCRWARDGRRRRVESGGRDRPVRATTYGPSHGLTRGVTDRGGELLGWRRRPGVSRLVGIKLCCAWAWADGDCAGGRWGRRASSAASDHEAEQCQREAHQGDRRTLRGSLADLAAHQAEHHYARNGQRQREPRRAAIRATT
jgi:hypothetical protein